VHTILGDVRVVVNATVVSDGKTVLDRSPAQCMHDWEVATLSVLATAFAMFAVLCIGVYVISRNSATALSARSQRS
jgi:hypothetical protein